MALAPIKWRSKIILAKAESSYGVDPTPSGSADAMLMTDVELRPMEGQDVSRNLERPFLGAQETIPAGLHAVLTGSVELVGSGSTGVAPAWSPLIRACGVAEVVTADDTPGDGTVEYTPATDDHESVALHFYIGTTRHVMLGCRGTVVVTLNAQGIPVARYTITGLFTTPSNETRPSVDLSGFAVPQIASKANTPTFTFGGVSFVLREFSFNLGNDVQPRLLIGHESIQIVDRNEQITATVEAVPLTTFNPFSEAATSQRNALVLQHGSAAGRRVKFEAPSCSLARLANYTQNQNLLEWPLAMSPQPDEGDDQWTITLT